jgi:chromosome segregation ATPase
MASKVKMLEQEVQRLQFENELKKSNIVELETEINTKDAEMAELKQTIAGYEDEKNNQEKKANQVKEVFRYVILEIVTILVS